MADSLLADLSRLGCENGFTDLVLNAGGDGPTSKAYAKRAHTYTAHALYNTYNT